MAATVQREISVTSNDVNPDGFAREATLVDNQLPGPVIKGNMGDRFEITVANDLQSDQMYKVLSVHWHGIHMYHTTWSDGSATVSQCPVIPNNKFTYVWDTSEARGSRQSGTFWYHSHFSSQYCDGLRGPLIIRDDAEDKKKFNYDIDSDDHIISLGDWFHSYGKDFHPGPFSRPQIPDSIIINGRGVDPYNPTKAAIDALSVITVQPGKRYRMRVIQMSCYTAFDYSIDGHALEIIEADSILMKPYTVDSVTIYAGQRYSHILDTRNKRPDAYWIRAQPERLKIKYAIRGATGASATVPYWKNSTNVAVLRYTNSPNQWPVNASDISVPATPRILNETAMRPYTDVRAPGNPVVGAADINITLSTTFNSTRDGLFRINNSTFTPPRVPMLLQIMSGARDAADLMPQGTTYVLPRDKVVEVRIKGTSRETGGPHPFHLHGHDFYVIKAAGSNVTNFVNPMQRDTISSGLENDEAIIRFKTDNPGPWFLHCHLDWHLDMGMGVVFAEDTKRTKAQNPVSQEWNELCDKYNNYVESGGENREMDEEGQI